MNCPKCGADMPAGAAYCPSCGTPRSEIDQLLQQAARGAKKVVDTGVAAVDRAAKGLEPAVDKAVKTIRPAVGEAAKFAKDVADKTVAAVRPAVAKVAEKTEEVARKVKEKAKPRG